MSEAEHLPGGKSDTDLAVEAFVDSMMEIHPDLDREEFFQTIHECVQDAVPDEEESEDEEE